MAGLFASAVTAFCVGVAPGTYNNACNHAIDAGTKQTGLRQNADRLEDFSVSKINQHVEKDLGRPVASTIAVGSYLYRVVNEKSITVRVPTLGICNSAKSQITPNSAKLMLEWRW